MNHFQCETYIIHSGWLRQGILFSCNCNIKVTWLPEVGVTIKYKWGIMAFYIVLYNYIFPCMSSSVSYLYTWHVNMVYICLNQWLNRKWPLHFLLSLLPMMLCVVPSFYTSHCFTTHVSTAKWTSGYMEQNDGMEKGMEQWTYTVAANQCNWRCSVYLVYS